MSLMTVNMAVPNKYPPFRELFTPSRQQWGPFLPSRHSPLCIRHNNNTFLRFASPPPPPVARPEGGGISGLLSSLPSASASASASALCLRDLASPLGSPAGSSEYLIMGSLATEADLPMTVPSSRAEPKRKPRILCLHGFRTSGEIMRKQLVGKWPETVLSRLDLVFADAPFPAQGKSDVEDFFPPPYYEWFQFNKKFTEYRNSPLCLKYIEDLMIERGPFDGLMGFSQGAIISGALPGMQAKGLALARVPPVKFVVIISGARFPFLLAVEEMAYSDHITCPSLHFLGEMDSMRRYGELLLESYVEPMVIRHPKGHTVPTLDDKSLETVKRFIETIEEVVAEGHSHGVN